MGIWKHACVTVMMLALVGCAKVSYNLQFVGDPVVNMVCAGARFSMGWRRASL